jgi:3-oxoadipate enol-lactonase/4-carboxymuconolactone decarboxylase
MAFARNGDTKLFWRSDGVVDKPVLLLLNSIGTDVGLWDRAVPHLLPHFRLLRMDARGHGASDVPPGDYSIDDLAADAFAVMDAADVRSAAVCGVSLGGMVAMNMAMTAPERVSALALACTSAAMDREVWNARVAEVRARGMAGLVHTILQRFFSDGFRARHPEIVDTFRSGLTSMNAQGYAGCGAAIRDMLLLDRLPEIKAPSLFIAGSKDVSTRFKGHGDRIAAAIPCARVVTLDAAHLACVEDPSNFAHAIIAFVTGSSDGADARTASEVLYEQGLKTRRAVLGDEWVDRSLARRTPFNEEFQAMITRIAWHEVWNRPGLDHRTRRLLVLAITASLGRWEEFRLHVKAGLAQGGFTVEELKETLMQTAVYAGVPAANTAFAEASEILRDRDAEKDQ